MSKRLLLDSHVVIWLLFEPKHVSSTCQDTITAAEEVFVSIASLWELTLKANKGLLRYNPKDIIAGRTAMGTSLLPITETHLSALNTTTLPHKDPFDTLLVTQAITEKLTFVTADKIILESACKTFDPR